MHRIFHFLIRRLSDIFLVLQLNVAIEQHLQDNVIDTICIRPFILLIESLNPAMKSVYNRRRRLEVIENARWIVCKFWQSWKGVAKRWLPTPSLQIETFPLKNIQHADTLFTSRQMETRLNKNAKTFAIMSEVDNHLSTLPYNCWQMIYCIR